MPHDRMLMAMGLNDGPSFELRRLPIVDLVDQELGERVDETPKGLRIVSLGEQVVSACSSR